jgi:hypothetical protein
MTTSLSDLNDVGDLSGASDDDYLGYDNTSGLWVPMAPPAAGGADWVANTGTLTYPAGDNGWTYVNDMRSEPFEARHAENTSSIPSDDNALIDTINVTSAMVDIGGQSGLAYPITGGLSINLSALVVNGSGFISWRHAVERNGVLQQYRDQFVSASGAVRVVANLKTPAADGDTIKVHSWLENTTGADGLDFTVILGAPITLGFNVPGSSEDGDIMFVWLPTVPGHQQVETGPDGLDMSVSGSTSPGIQHRYQSGVNAGNLVENVSTNRVLFGLRLPHGTIGTPTHGTSAAGSSTSAGDPMLLRTQQFTSYGFWTLQVPVPS